MARWPSSTGFGLDRGVTRPAGPGPGRGFGYWLALLASIAGLVLAAMRRSAD